MQNIQHFLTAWKKLIPFWNQAFDTHSLLSTECPCYHIRQNLMPNICRFQHAVVAEVVSSSLVPKKRITDEKRIQ